MTTTDYIYPGVPERISSLDRDRHGRPIPWFVWRHPDTGEPDFRVIRPDGVDDALRWDTCWVCGTRRGRHAAFVIGPMCGINRTTAEPPSHLMCAMYAAQHCPFMTTPTMRRRHTEQLLEEHDAPAGTTCWRNPGVALVWSSKTWRPFNAPNGTLINVGEPTAVRWYAEGKVATREQVMASVESGLPLLRAEAAKETFPSDAMGYLDREIARFMPLVPAPSGLDQ